MVRKRSSGGDRKPFTPESSLAPTEEVEERETERNVNVDTSMQCAFFATYVIQTSTKTAIEIQELASGRSAGKCAGLIRN